MDTHVRIDDERLQRILFAAPKMAQLLLQLEAEAYADARHCPFCDADDEEGLDALAHAVDCELDRTLFDAGLRPSSAQSAVHQIGEPARVVLVGVTSRS